ncbi:hypothetical protein BDV29DRAFT_178473 [Aspergillus leporis]|uniref:Uncharacterized protein n=1 Tax=Aspergillus leporis TaxID=41062 RepID=A0A5N5WXC7_9EURO|nr:hypothetical protein BDV29DRAFT_178473 [Aspergillus leporis]
MRSFPIRAPMEYRRGSRMVLTQVRPRNSQWQKWMPAALPQPWPRACVAHFL